MSKLQTPFRYDFVGSFLRPQALKDAKAALRAGKIDQAAFDKVVNEEITKVVAQQKELGYHVITDGEFRRTFWHLKEQGWFATASGFLIGRPHAAFEQNLMGVNAYNAVTDILSEIGAPVVMDADIGHVAPMMPLIIGSNAHVTVEENDITVEMSL